MKIAKTQLKNLIKECLIELLSEGLGGQLIESTNANVRQRQTNQQPQVRRQMPSQVRQQPQRQPQQNVTMKAAITEAAGKNDVMRGIFEDTARTTLPTMMSSDRPGFQPVGTSPEEMIVEQSDPEEIFGSENVDKWAALAFSGGQKTNLPPVSEARKLSQAELDAPAIKR